MKKKNIFQAIAMAAAMAAMTIAGAMVAMADEATFSRNWYAEADGRWRLKDGSGNIVRNAWVCDDAVAANADNVWYLLDAEGYMIADPLVQDNTGNYYSLETEHNGYYGMLRYQSGVYGGIALELDSAHDGGFAKIMNQDGLAAMMAAFQVRYADIDNSNIVHTKDFGSVTSGSGNDQVPAQPGQRRADGTYDVRDYDSQGLSRAALDIAMHTREENKKYVEVYTDGTNGLTVHYANGLSTSYYLSKDGRAGGVGADNGDTTLIFNVPVNHRDYKGEAARLRGMGYDAGWDVGGLYIDDLWDGRVGLSWVYNGSGSPGLLLKGRHRSDGVHMDAEVMDTAQLHEHLLSTWGTEWGY